MIPPGGAVPQKSAKAGRGFKKPTGEQFEKQNDSNVDLIRENDTAVYFSTLT